MNNSGTEAAASSPAIPDEPTVGAHPRLLLTRVPESRPSGEPLIGAVRVMAAGAAALLIVHEYRRADSSMRPAVLCSAAALAIVAAPR